MLGVSVLVAVLDGATRFNALHTFHSAYALMAVASAAAAVTGLALGRIRASAPEEALLVPTSVPEGV